MRSPNLRELIEFLDGMSKTTVAAIQGTAFGGGCELALGCHYRVAWPGARLGLPEVKLGLLPGAGGTQRLPRLVGPEAALRVIVTGEPVRAEQALAMGLVDAMMEGDDLAPAIAWAGQARPPRRIRDMDDKLAAVREDPHSLDKLAAPLLKGSGAQAPRACVEAVRAAATMPFDEGLARERQLFEGLVVGDESRAQRYAFFAEREAQKADVPPGTKPREVRRAAVIGAGTMGGGIAMAFANAGIPVTVIETEQGALDRGLARVGELYATSVKRGSIDAAEGERRRGRVQGSLDYGAVADADLIVEAAFEDMGVKEEVFGKLDRVAKPGAVLATNTSYLDVDRIARATKRPADVLGMHFFSPANVMRLVEVVHGKETSPEALATAMEVSRRIGKVAVPVGVCFGFVGNRMLARRSEQAEQLLLEGASPQQVDEALERFGFRMGPFAMGDLAGLDVGWRVRQAFGKRAPVGDALVDAGRFGQKTGKGYYRYEGRERQPDPEVDTIIAGASQKEGIARRSIDEAEILDRLVLPMVNEGARILEEGVARRPGDVDAIWLYGYNWPAWRGGPMFYADLRGLPEIAARLNELADRSGDDSLRPAPLLAKLASERRGFLG
ncbi:MAG: enoyl-CoA hydratase/isomerase family protein [Acetobacteraceae bacterium]|nr:enoyl-CoA hydratase/isomerase family protein [Acetobacteraceae bacterium]